MATYIELQKQIAELQKQADALKTQEREGVIGRMKEAIDVYGITAADLGLARTQAVKTRGNTAGRKAVTGDSAGRAAYADLNGNTWGGRGPRPAWLKEAIAGGAKLEDFAQAR